MISSPHRNRSAFVIQAWTNQIPPLRIIATNVKMMYIYIRMKRFLLQCIQKDEYYIENFTYASGLSLTLPSL